VPNLPTRLLAALAAVAAIGGSLLLAPTTPVQAVDDGDWLGLVNTYRSMSGLAPVAANPEWAGGTQAHSCYMILNDIAHDEIPGLPGYTPEGDLAGNSGNVAVSGSTSADAGSHINLWMTGPFHAIGILRHNLARTAYGECEDEAGARWKSAATLDVLRGIDPSRLRPANPIVFPGDGATVPLDRFIVESPNPMSLCGWTGEAGLPLIAMMPSRVTGATSTLQGPDGPIETCTLHAGNTTGTARAILNADNAIVVMPRVRLADGQYHVEVTSDGGAASWNFTVDVGAPLQAGPPPPLEPTTPTADVARFMPSTPHRRVDTRIGQGAHRLGANTVTRIEIADRDVAAISANFVSVDPSAVGFLTAYNCTTAVPNVSTIGYSPGRAIANQAIVPLDEGALCLYSSSAVDVVVDVNGEYRGDDGAGFVPVTPRRLYDTAANSPFAPGEERSITVAGNGAAPANAKAVALNVTAVAPDAHGYVQVYPCGAPTAGEISTINYAPGDFRPNSVVVPVDASGNICIRTLTTSGVIVDFTGYFVSAGGLAFQALDPVRMFDSRSTSPELNPLTGGARAPAGYVVRIPIAGVRGVPAGAEAVSVNLTATGATEGSYLSAFPCGESLPASSNVNITPAQPAASNGAMIQLGTEGALCVFTLNPVHVIVDVNGVWL